MKTLYCKDRREWRAWLKTNGESSDEVWLRYYKKNSAKQGILYEDSVEEALCFGWIDGKIKRVDEEQCARRFTPRKPGSQWSASNLSRVKKLLQEGRMTAAGFAAFRARRLRKPAPQVARFPADVENQFKKQSRAWDNFSRFPAFYRRMTARWVASAKREETRSKRLNQLITLSARNERMKFM